MSEFDDDGFVVGLFLEGLFEGEEFGSFGGGDSGENEEDGDDLSGHGARRNHGLENFSI